MQIVEYQLRWGDVHQKNGDPYSVGVATYGLFHPKDDRLMDALWKNVGSGRTSKDLTESL